MSDRLVELVGGYTIADNVPARGTVSVNPLVLAGNSAPEKRLVTRHTVVGQLDSEGRFSVEVLDSFDPDWNVEGGVPYEVREYIIGGRGRSYVVYITGPGPVDLFDLQPVEVYEQTVAPFPVPGPVGPANSLAVGTVTTLPPGSDATATISGTPPAQVLDLGIPKGLTGNPQDTALGDLTDVDTSRDATGMVVTRQSDGTYKGAHVRVSLNQLTDVTVPANTPPNSLLGTVGEGTTPGQAEWEGLHLDYVQATVLGPLPSTVADLGQRVTELEHTGEVIPPDLDLGVDLYSGSFTRIIGCAPITLAPAKRIRLTLATTPGPNGAVFASLADISGTGAVWADFNGTIGKAVDSSGQGLNGASLKEAIRRGQIVTVHRGDDGQGHPTLVVEKVEDPADAGSSLTLDALKDVSAPATTPAGKVLGTTAIGAWGAVDPVGEHVSAVDPHPQYLHQDEVYVGKTRTSRPNATDRLVEAWDGAAWVPIHYDSGIRDVSAFINTSGGWAVPSGWACKMQRVNNTVTLFVTAACVGDPPQTKVMTIPPGWGPAVGTIYGYHATRGAASDTVRNWDAEADAGLTLINPYLADIDYTYTHIWPCDPPIPASLPGTLITTAP